MQRFCSFRMLLVSAYVAQAQVLGDPPDVSQDFQKMENVYFVGSRVTSFDTTTGQGVLQWDRYLRNTTLSFNKVDVGFARGKATEFPGTEYDQDLWKELVAKGYHVKNDGGLLPFKDATIDMSNPEAVNLYQGKLSDLLQLAWARSRLTLAKVHRYRVNTLRV